jgi:hypothetical protein
MIVVRVAEVTSDGTFEDAVANWHGLVLSCANQDEKGFVVVAGAFTPPIVPLKIRVC